MVERKTRGNPLSDSRSTCTGGGLCFDQIVLLGVVIVVQSFVGVSFYSFDIMPAVAIHVFALIFC